MHLDPNISEHQTQQLKSLLDRFPGMAFRSLPDRNCTITFASAGCKELTGWDHEELTQNKKITYCELIHEDDRSIVEAAKKDGISANKPYEVDYRIITKGQQIKWVRETGIALRKPSNNEIDFIEGSVIDISLQKEYSILLEERELRLSQIMKVSDIGILLIDRSGTIKDINEAFSEMTGLQKLQVVNKKAITLANKFLKPKDIPAMIPKIVQGLTGDKTPPFEITYNHKYIRIDTADSSDENILAFFTDITKQKEYEDTLKGAMIKSDESDRLKSSFLANMSHEIRTPMNGILGFSELLRDPGLNEAEKIRFIDIIHANSEQLLSIIDDVLDLSRIEAGRLGLYPEKFDPYILLKDLAETTKVLVKQRPITVNLKYDLPVKATVESDKKRVRQILFKLISNAIKFTEEGQIELGCYRNSWEHIEFYVKDSGIGIPKEVGQKIFERFRQGKEGDTRPYGGTGLGLSLSKSLVNLLGGQIGYTSIEGKGSHFYFTIPDLLKSLD